MTRDRGWVIAQFVAAGVLGALSLIGIVGFFLDYAELTFSFGGAIQAFAVFPGAVLSLVVNALVMRLHRDAGLGSGEKVLLLIQGCFVFGLVVMHFINDALGVLIIVWPMYILLAVAVLIAAIVRNVEVTRMRAAAPPPPVPSP